MGAGVPSPCSAKRPNESTSPDTPARISAETTKRVSSTPRNDNLNSQCEIHHGHHAGHEDEENGGADDGGGSSHGHDPFLAIIALHTGSVRSAVYQTRMWRAARPCPAQVRCIE